MNKIELKKIIFKEKLGEVSPNFSAFKVFVLDTINENLTPEAFEDTYMNIGTFNPFSQAEPNEIIKFSAEDKYDLFVELLENAFEVLEALYDEEE